MKRILTLSTVLLAGLSVAPEILAQGADTITTNTAQTAERPLSSEAVTDPRIAAERFIEHVNYARVALAMKDSTLAKEHISQARSLVSVIKAASTDMRRIDRVESGRVVYDYETDRKYHYFPIEAGPIEMKEIKKGPFWAKKGLAVTDAEIVYVALDLTGNKADERLVKADQYIRDSKLKEADSQLAELTEETVKIDEKVAMPVEKARDNISLARQFVAMKNYDGARFALKHADKALGEMEKDEAYKDRRPAIGNMRREVASLQETITANDPTMLEKTDAKLGQWWKDIKSWAADKQS